MLLFPRRVTRTHASFPARPKMGAHSYRDQVWGKCDTRIETQRQAVDRLRISGSLMVELTPCVAGACPSRPRVFWKGSKLGYAIDFIGAACVTRTRDPLITNFEFRFSRECMRLHMVAENLRKLGM
jgi:hypothetical protein